jgi:hypothetical protein
MKDQIFTDAELKAYADHIVQDYIKWCGPGASKVTDFRVTFEPGSKFIRVVTTSGASRSSHSFLDAQGNIWKSASWKAPTKNFTRGDIIAGDFSRITWTGAR